MTPALNSFGLGFSFQTWTMARSVDTYFTLIGAPFNTLILMSMMLYSGRTDLAAYAVIAPTLMTLWAAALMFAGEMISEDRENGRLELLVASPVSLVLLVFGRLCGAMLISLPAFVLAMAVAGLFFGYWVDIHHPAVFILTAVATMVSTAATATALSALFIAARGARIVQNTLSTPVFVLGGVMVPTSIFPFWLEGVSRFVYLSWGADLFRDALSPEPVESAALRLLITLALGAVALLLGYLTLVRFVRRARADGGLSRA